MNPFHEACRAWFAFTLIVALIWISIFTHTVTLISSLGLISELRSQDTCVAIAVVAFRTLLLCNPQIKIKRDTMNWDEALSSAPAMVLMNHASFFDFFLFTAMLPPSFALSGHVRTVMSASLTKIPLVGKAIGDHSGSFKVFFQAKGAGFGKGDAADFSVDRDRQQVETERMEKHIDQHRGIIAFCPEGGMNKAPEEGLKPFRRGSFAQAAKYSTPIWGAALYGCTAAWPRDAKVGGYPCTVAVSLKQLMVPAVGATPAEVADACQQSLQQQVDALAARHGVNNDAKVKQG